jgi:hypothetical protein
MINDGESVQLVQAGYHASVLDFGQPTDVQRELRAGVRAGKREAGPLYVPVRQTETFADLAETKSRIHVDVIKLTTMLRSRNKPNLRNAAM